MNVGLLPSLVLLADPEPHPSAWNMALDEALLETAAKPVLRFYRWQRPAVSFGCFQPWAEVSERFPGRELVRRPTGGGAVEHGGAEETATYALVVPRAGGALASLGERPMAAFRRVHAALSEAMIEQGFKVKLHDGKDAAGFGGACFHDQPVPGDLVLQTNHRKTAGAAQRRTRTGLLHQGSIRLTGLDVNRLMADFAQTLVGPAEVDGRSLASEELVLAEGLARTKYALPAWTERRLLAPKINLPCRSVP